MRRCARSSVSGAATEPQRDADIRRTRARAYPDGAANAQEVLSECTGPDVGAVDERRGAGGGGASGKVTANPAPRKRAMRRTRRGLRRAATAVRRRGQAVCGAGQMGTRAVWRRGNALAGPWTWEGGSWSGSRPLAVRLERSLLRLLGKLLLQYIAGIEIVLPQHGLVTSHSISRPPHNIFHLHLLHLWASYSRCVVAPARFADPRDGARALFPSWCVPSHRRPHHFVYILTHSPRPLLIALSRSPSLSLTTVAKV